MANDVMKLTFLRHTDKNGSVFHTVKGEENYANFKIAEHYYHGVLRQVSNDTKLLDRFLELFSKTTYFDNIPITEAHDNRRVKSAFSGFGELKNEMVDPKLVDGDLQFKIKPEAYKKLIPLIEDNGTLVGPKDDTTFTVKLDYVAASLLKARKQRIKLYYNGEEAGKVVVSLPLFEETVYVSNTFNNEYMRPRAKFAQVGFNLDKSYITRHMDEYMKINHIADMGTVSISKKFENADQYLSVDMNIDASSPVNDYVVLTYDSRPNDMSILLPADSVFSIEREGKRKLEYFTLNMSEYEYFHLCDTKGITVKNDQGKDYMIHAVDVLQDLYLEHDNRHAFLSRGAGYTNEFKKAPFGYADVIDFVYGTSGMKTIGNLAEIYLIPENLGNMNKANKIYGDYVNLSEIFKAGKEPLSLEELKNIDICTDGEYNKILYSCVAEAIIRNAQYNDDPTFPFKSGSPSFRLYEINNKFTGEKFNNVILCYGAGGSMWTGKKDKELIDDDRIYSPSKPLFINFPFRVGNIDDAKRYVISNLKPDAKSVDLSFLDGEKVYRRSSLKDSSVQQKWHYDSFDRFTSTEEAIECYTNYGSEEVYEETVKKVTTCLADNFYNNKHMIFADSENDTIAYEYSHNLVTKKKPWSCNVNDISKFDLKDLITKSKVNIPESEVASFMNKIYGYEKYEVIDDLDGSYLYGKQDGKDILLAKICDDYLYNSFKDKVYEEWLNEPLKSY